jgi:hypothetical protein
VTPVPHVILDYAPDRHEAFVLGSWEGRAPPGTPGHGRPPGRERAVMHACLRRASTRCVVAAHPEDEDQLLGWAAVEPGAVLWVYVRHLFGKLRRRGLGTSGVGLFYSPLEELCRKAS